MEEYNINESIGVVRFPLDKDKLHVVANRVYAIIDLVDMKIVKGGLPQEI